MSPVRLIVDTDTAGDDVFSLLIALRRPEAQLEAITIVCGNVAFEQQVENASTRWRWPGAGRGARGTRMPETVHRRMGGGGVRPRHGRHGRLVLPEGEAAPRRRARRRRARPARERVAGRAVDPRPGAADQHRGRGDARPSLPEKVDHLWIMGGGAGNITPAAEYNFFVDPEAAKIVFAAGFRTTLFTWSLTLTHGVFDDEKLAQDRRAGHRPISVLRSGQPEGARVRGDDRHPGQHAPGRDDLRGDPRSVADPRLA